MILHSFEILSSIHMHFINTACPIYYVDAYDIYKLPRMRRNVSITSALIYSKTLDLLLRYFHDFTVENTGITAAIGEDGRVKSPPT